LRWILTESRDHSAVIRSHRCRHFLPWGSDASRRRRISVLCGPAPKPPSGNCHHPALRVAPPGVSAWAKPRSGGVEGSAVL